MDISGTKHKGRDPATAENKRGGWRNFGSRKGGARRSQQGEEPSKDQGGTKKEPTRRGAIEGSRGAQRRSQQGEEPSRDQGRRVRRLFARSPGGDLYLRRRSNKARSHRRIKGYPGRRTPAGAVDAEPHRPRAYESPADRMKRGVLHHQSPKAGTRADGLGAMLRSTLLKSPRAALGGCRAARGARTTGRRATRLPSAERAVIRRARERGR